MRALPDCLIRFEVPQKAVIYSGWLRIPELLVFVVLLSIFVLYNWLYQLGFVKVVTLRTRSLPQLTQLQDNWDDCSFQRNNCKYTQPDVEQLDWCNQSGWNKYKFPKCKVFTEPTRAAGPLSENSLFVGSSVEFIGEENHIHEDYSIANFGQFLMRFKCGFYHDHVGSLFLTSGPGFMQFAGEAEPRVIPYRYANGSLSVPEWTAKFKRCSTVPLVGSSYSNATCFSQINADYYGIELLLRAANVSIHEGDSRWQGIGIRMHVRFTNVDVKDFWSSPIGFKNKYIITPTKLYLSELAAPEFWIEHVQMDSAAVTRIKGVYFAIEAEGSFGIFWPFYAASKFAVATLFLGVGKMISSRVLTEIYKRMASLQHVSVLHQLGEYEEHEGEESNRIHSLLQEGHPMDKISKSPNVRSLRESHRA